MNGIIRASVSRVHAGRGPVPYRTASRGRAALGQDIEPRVAKGIDFLVDGSAAAVSFIAAANTKGAINTIAWVAASIMSLRTLSDLVDLMPEPQQAPEV